jgi:hypothetical protein
LRIAAEAATGASPIERKRAHAASPSLDTACAVRHSAAQRAFRIVACTWPDRRADARSARWQPAELGQVFGEAQRALEAAARLIGGK